MRASRPSVVAVALLGGVLMAVVSAQTRPPAAKFLTQVPWAERGQWIRADTHVHTRFTDGGHTVDEVVAKAIQYGCQAIAITDHADRQMRGASEEYFTAIDSVRRARPDLVVLAGLEWNIPPYGGREHATVLVAPGAREAQTLAEFKRRFDDYDRDDGGKPVASDALAWLASTAGPRDVPPIVVYNHPSRKDASSLENVDDVAAWRTASRLVVGFEGAPGHQGKPPIGSYSGKEEPIDRWDPVVARPGDAWDRLLQRGVDVHGAMASSDFHNANPASLNDFWPCQFSETWYYVPERTPAGLLRALSAGTFFAAHGHIARDVAFTVVAPGLARPALPGEVLEVPVGTTVTVDVAFTVPETDWAGQPNEINRIELFVITPQGTEVRETAVAGSGTRHVREPLVVGPAGLVVRARGRRVVADGPDLLFYTNAIRIRTAR